MAHYKWKLPFEMNEKIYFYFQFVLRVREMHFDPKANQRTQARRSTTFSSTAVMESSESILRNRRAFSVLKYFCELAEAGKGACGEEFLGAVCKVLRRSRHPKHPSPSRGLGKEVSLSALSLECLVN